MAKSPQLLKDAVGGGDPGEGLGLRVVVGDELLDLLNQLLGARERSAANGLLRDLVEPDFHLIEPGTVRRRIVHVEPRPLGKPQAHLQELLVPMARLALG